MNDEYKTISYPQKSSKATSGTNFSNEIFALPHSAIQLPFAAEVSKESIENRVGRATPLVTQWGHGTYSVYPILYLRWKLE